MNTRKTASSSFSTTNTPAPGTENLEQRIRERAYEFYLERGQADGHADDDWMKAEQEILGNMRSQPAAA